MRMIRIACTAILAAATVFGGQSVVLNSASQASATLSSAFSSIENIRLEFRIHNFGQAPDFNQWFFTAGNINGAGFGVRFYPTSLILSLKDFGDGEQIVNTDLTGRPTDVIVRLQRDLSNSRLTMEVWNPDGTNYSHVEAALASPGKLKWAGQLATFGAASFTTDLAYLRMYSTVLPENSPPPSRTNGDLADWEFEGNLTDKSGRRTNLKGSATYVPTPSYPINVSFGQFGSQRVWSVDNGTLTLNASSTYSSVDDPAYTYSWSLAGGPGTGTFSGPNSVATTFTASNPGDYRIALTAGDGSTSNSLTVDFGAVTTNSNGTVVTGNAAMDQAMGPLTMWGTSPWPWYDFTEMANADALYSLVTAPPVYGETALTGTVTPATQGGQSLVGTGTHFFADIVDFVPTSGSGSAYSGTISGVSSLSDLNLRDRFFKPDVNCSSPVTININSLGALPLTNPTCTAGSVYQLYYNPTANNFSINTNRPLIWLWWNAPDGTGTGRTLYSASIQDDTHLTLDTYFLPPIAQAVNIQYSHPDTGELGVYWNYVGQPSNNLNYYDVVHALFKLYYRTGLTKYQTEARMLADNWYKYASGQGYAISAPRVIGYLGLIDRAIDGHYSIWGALDYYLNYPWPLTTLFTSSTPYPVGTIFDARETGYAVRFLARAASLFANSDGTPNAAKRTQYCGELHNVVANLLVAAQDPLGQWQEDLYSENISYPGARINGNFGSAPWRDAMSGLALEESYDVLTGCGDRVTAAAALSTVQKFANLVHDYGQGTGFGQFYSIQYASTTETNVHAGTVVPGSGQAVAPATTGTLSVTSGSAIVTGTGTNFTTIFAKVGHNPVDTVDATFIGIPAQSANSLSCNATLEVASVQSDTQLTLTQNWACASASAINGGGYGWVAAPHAARNCNLMGSQAQTCEGDPDPSLSHEVHALWSWIYWKTGDLKYRQWALQSFGTDYGGAGGGPGTPTPPVGPYATGATGNFVWALPACSSSSPPCGGYGAINSLGKNYAFSAGAGNASNALAYFVLGTPAPAVVKQMTGPVKVNGAAQ